MRRLPFASILPTLVIVGTMIADHDGAVEPWMPSFRAFTKALLAAAALAATVSPAHARPAASDQLVGSWVAEDRDTRGITRVVVRREGGEFFVRVWGRCHPTDCAWGLTPATLRDDVPKPELKIAFAPDFARRHMALRVVRPGLLAYRLETSFIDGSGRADQVSEELLKRAPRRRR